MANHLRPAGAPVDGVKFAAVSYVELAAEDGFAALVESIAKVSPNAVKSWPPNAQCAFYINAYNILCAEHVCRTIRAGGGLPPSVKDCVPDGVKGALCALRGQRSSRKRQLSRKAAPMDQKFYQAGDSVSRFEGCHTRSLSVRARVGCADAASNGSSSTDKLQRVDEGC